jgi:hypothetical protein
MLLNTLPSPLYTLLQSSWKPVGEPLLPHFGHGEAAGKDLCSAGRRSIQLLNPHKPHSRALILPPKIASQRGKSYTGNLTNIIRLKLQQDKVIMK